MSRRRICCCAGLAVVLGLAAFAGLFRSTGQKTVVAGEPAVHKAAASVGRHELSLAEIEQIRRQLRDQQPLRGTIFQTEPGAEVENDCPLRAGCPLGDCPAEHCPHVAEVPDPFAAALRHVAHGWTLLHIHDPGQRGEPAPRGTWQGPHPLGPDMDDPGRHIDHFVGTLRMTARMLDDRANDLEEGSQFERADQLRRLAQQLRREARQP